MSSNRLLATLFAAVLAVSLTLSSSTAFAKDTYSKRLDLNSKGVEYYNSGDYVKAIETFEKAQNISADDIASLNNLETVYLKLNEREKALKYFVKSIKLFKPDDSPFHKALIANAYNLRGVLYFKEADYESAFENFVEAFKLNRNDDSVLSNLVTIYRETNYRDAEDWKTLGKAYYDIEDYDKAVECYKEAFELSPTDVSALSSIGAIYKNREMYNAAIEYFDKALTVTPEDVELLKALGFSYYNFGDHDRAVACYTKAFELSPTDVSALSSVGSIYYNLGNYDKAFEYFNKTLEIAPEDAECWRKLGEVQLNLKNYEQAAECFEKALQFVSTDEVACESIANCYEQISNVYKAAGDDSKANEFSIKSSKAHIKASHITIYNRYHGTQKQVRKPARTLIKPGTQIKENLT